MEATNKKSKMFMNPMIKKLSKIEESSDHAATYRGIAGKTCYFMVCAVLGIALYFCFRKILTTGEFILYEDKQIYLKEGAIVIFALVISLFAPILAFLIKPLVPMLGTLYCVSFSYSMAWAGDVFADEYGVLIDLAVGITVLLVAVMAVLYTTRIIKVGHKFRTVVSVLFFSMLGSGILLAVCSLVPGLKGIISYLLENAVLGLVAGVLYVIIACLFLMVDFDTIEQAVNRKLPKKYEWIAAFGLAYTIFYLFLKVFSLLTKVKGNESK